MTNDKLLLAIVELGGYPDFTATYEQAGYRVVSCRSVRKAIQFLKTESPAVIVAEFNFQSDFRDRTSNLESLLAVVERKDDCRLIVFYEQDYAHQLERLRQQYQPHATLPFPIDTEKLNSAL
ncbi:MAG: hypothetical protein OEY52_00380 [Gammaproteobacteria bacterium]|nr:hypothetical protein [Gammaproteobacteria bacterium]